MDIVDEVDADGIRLRFVSSGDAGVVFHVYDRNALEQPPRRYTVGAGRSLEGRWSFDPRGGYDLWVLGPNGFHRQFTGNRSDARTRVRWRLAGDTLLVDVPRMPEGGGLTANWAGGGGVPLDAGTRRWSLAATQGWYDLTIGSIREPHFVRRLAGRLDQAGRPTISDPFQEEAGTT
jgi:phospholipase C